VLGHTFLLDDSHLLWLCDPFVLNLDNVAVQVWDFFFVAKKCFAKRQADFSVQMIPLSRKPAMRPHT
jgi:hypothetical protein